MTLKNCVYNTDKKINAKEWNIHFKRTIFGNYLFGKQEETI